MKEMKKFISKEVKKLVKILPMKLQWQIDWVSTRVPVKNYGYETELMIGPKERGNGLRVKNQHLSYKRYYITSLKLKMNVAREVLNTKERTYKQITEENNDISNEKGDSCYEDYNEVSPTSELVLISVGVYRHRRSRKKKRQKGSTTSSIRGD